jgi:pyruvate-ferredoxin/flavodoxin oxidoreductase
MSNKVNIDGNAAVAHVAHATNEVIAIYPITPSSVMGELADEFSAHGRQNIWGQIPEVSELQSEGGAAGAIHGALTAGALATTFTASQGLLLMIPNMYKIAGELAPTVFHVSARSISCQALSIFGDHSDIAAVRDTGFGLIASGNPQEVMDNALAAQQCTLKSRVPFLHFFDGFRTSHEIQKVEEIDYAQMRAMIDEEDVLAVRERALRPEKPSMRGTAQNPDLYFQGREAVNKYYDACPEIMQRAYDRLAKLTGRQYHLFDYFGDPRAESVMVIMGSGAEAAEEAVLHLNRAKGTKYGLIKVRLYRPFSAHHFLAALPPSVKRVITMDRTKAPGAFAEPLYLDVAAVIADAVRRGGLAALPLVIGGRYGLSSKEFAPAMVYACFKHAQGPNPFHGFTVGIDDDVTHLSLDYSEEVDSEDPSVYRAKFYGLGADGTVGANKNSIKVVGDNTDKYVQGFFVYDSKKAGGVTCSHLRFSDKPIKSTYLITKPDFVGIHAESYLGKIDMLRGMHEGGTVVINTYIPAEALFDDLPRLMQEQIIAKKLKVYTINAYDIVDKLGLPGRINTTMQGAFFKLSGVLPEEVYRREIEGAIEKSYKTKGKEVVDTNLRAFRAGIEEVRQVPVPAVITKSGWSAGHVPDVLPELVSFIQDVVEPVMAQEGDRVKVSQMPFDGAFPTNTTMYEKRSIAVRLPKWRPEHCVECNLCSLVCPHAAIRPKISKAELITDEKYVTIPVREKGAEADDRFRIQVYPDDCTGCGACFTACLGLERDAGRKPTGRKAIEYVHKDEILEDLRHTLKIFRALPPTDPKWVRETPKGSQFRQPLFGFSGACAGCGETPYVKLASQLFGTRMMQANATGCSSIYGGTAPTSPCGIDRLSGHGPAWSSSLFEDNAEFGYGFRLAVDRLHERAFKFREEMLREGGLPGAVADLLGRLHTIPEQYADPLNIEANREIAGELERALKSLNGQAGETTRTLLAYLPYFVKKSVWIVGGDGWAYDIGYGGLDHVIASGADVNLLVLDTEVYSNTGGQRSKASPLGAVTKFASAGKRTAKKDLALQAISYRSVYVTTLAYSANPAQAVRAMLEAERFPGASLLVCYAPCIEHGIDMSETQKHAKAAVESGYWPLFRYDPRRIDKGENPLIMDSKTPSISFRDYALGQNRFRRLSREYPAAFEGVMVEAEKVVRQRFLFYKQLAALDYSEFAAKVAEAVKADG